MLRKKVLFIDDNIDIHDIMSIVLEDDDIELHTAVKTCLVTDIPVINPDLILLDEWLPEKNGSVFCQELKNWQATCNIPVIMISAVFNLEVIAKQCHANAFISKPFNIDCLKQLINGYL